ncbi:MAG: pentapeptide repeat-containing protein, partial [Deltaproteobacteria bacterium]|nr:pentapeptide repeat-containing protein [Deltaproteobacteria bacterium]
MFRLNVFFLLIIFFVPTYVCFGFDADHLKQLIEKNKCIKCDLSQADLNGLHLRFADLSNSNLQGAKLIGTYLTKAILKNADLRGVQLKG